MSGRKVVSEQRGNFKDPSWPPVGTVSVPIPPNGSNPLQESFIKLEQAEQLRQHRHVSAINVEAGWLIE
jgi:hypothetical protein